MPNVKPMAAFSFQTSGLSASFNSSASSDPDGTIVSRAWDFGDGRSSSAANPTNAYTTAGTYTVTLTVTDNDGGTSTKTADVTVAPVPNVKPVANFGSTIADLTVNFDGSSSSDADGTITDYAWEFGDGETASIQKPVHTYLLAGTYQVKLTVTDNRGDTHSVTKPVTVTAPPAVNVFAEDAFSRVLASGWGSADVGGPWSLTGTAANYSVGGGLGSIKITRAGSGPAAYLNSVSKTNIDLTTGVKMDSMPTGAGTYFALNGRGTATDNYRGKGRVLPNGSVSLFLTKTVAGVETTLVTQNVSGLTYASGDQLQLRMQVTGTAPTQLKLKVWKSGTTEPTAWNLTTSDSTAGLQQAGGVGLWAYLSATATTLPVTVSFTALKATLPN